MQAGVKNGGVEKANACTDSNPVCGDVPKQ